MITKSSDRGKKQKIASSNERKRSDLSCKSCGHVFESFLEEIAERNAKEMAKHKTKETTERTCPKCGKTHDYSHSGATSAE